MGAPTEFRSIYRHGFARVAACTTHCALAHPTANAAAILEVAKSCHERGAAVAVFPELGISGYTISDLLHQSTLLDAVEQAVAELVAASADLLPLLLVGAPLRHAGALYNCALAIHRGAAAWCGAEGAPAQLPRILRAAAFRGRAMAWSAARSPSAT